MTKYQKSNLNLLIFFSGIYFLLFYFPNSVGSSDSNMITVFEPDEFVQLGHVLRMVRPKENLKKSILAFVFYRHYFYGYPFFAFSAFPLLLVRFFGGLENTTLIMVVLRQFISILPILVSIILLVYLQTRFKSRFRSLLLFFILLSIPGVTRNSFWWHPEGLVILFIVLTIFFLDRDDLEFKNNFLFAAVACGFAVGTKLLGLFFFLTIPTYIAIGYFQKRIDLKQAIFKSIQFVVVMFISIIISNPLLIFASHRADYLKTQTFQASKMSFGWEVAYPKGPSSWYKIIQVYYAEWYFVAFAFVAILVGIIKDIKRLLNIHIITWSLPFALYILYVIAIKPIHFFLPIALPLFSSILTIWPINSPDPKLFANEKYHLIKGVSYLSIIIIFWQLFVYTQQNINMYSTHLKREQTSESIRFFYEVKENHLGPLSELKSIRIYRDPRLYVPNSPPWIPMSSFKMLTYEYFEEKNPQVILLMRQRILDYTNDGIVPEDQAVYEKSYLFYTDAENGELSGYQLIYEDDFGLVYIRDNVYQYYFDK